MQKFFEGLAGGLELGARTFGQITPVRQVFVNAFAQKLKSQYRKMEETTTGPKIMVQYRLKMALAILYTMDRALEHRLLGPATLHGTISTIGREVLFPQPSSAKQTFINHYQTLPPSLLALSPTKTCNLQCSGCYADSGQTGEKLGWETLDRVVAEAHQLWGAYFFVISGGEPLIYRDKGKAILDLAQEHPESFFLMFTNGTLIDEGVAQRLRTLGNLTPAISVEGLRESTDSRRGAGVFDQVATAMRRLSQAQVPFGISLTATRHNFQELLADETLDFYFEKMGAMYGWLFQYMPIGRASSLELMPTAEQRLQMMQRMWEVVDRKHYFMADFWNSGILSNGCIAAGGRGGYLYIDWNGAVSPCVFMPYSPVNIKDIFAQGKNLNDVWNEPFFAEIREWQEKNKGGNLLRPCPIRDHHTEFLEILKKYRAKPTDENAKLALEDEKYHQGLEKFDDELARLADPIWKENYSSKT